MSLQELDLVFRSAMQSGVVAAEEGEMIASVRNLDSKKIKAGDAAMSSESNLGVAAHAVGRVSSFPVRRS